MEIKKYFEEVRQSLEKLTDEEFEQLLIDSGIEKCPYMDEVIMENLEYSKQASVYNQQNELYNSALQYITTYTNNEPDNNLKVA